MSNTLYLSLANNSFHGSIPHSLCSASKLQVLDLSHNKISGKVTHCLMNLGETLGVLNLGNNELTGHIPDTFPSSCALHTVVLNENRLAGPLPKSLAHCTALEVLDVGRNQIVGAFPCFLSHISKLLVLVLRNNKFHGPMGCPKDNGVWNIIQIVDAAFNNFSGELPVKWFRGWKKMISNDDGANSELSNIQFGRDNSDPIYYQDSVTVISKGQEMELVKILTIFTSIDFSYNQFEGPIPIELMKFKALYLLNLSHNAFSGQIPSSIGNLNQLESLDLSMNSLKGEIPRACQFELPIISEPLLQSSDSHLTSTTGAGSEALPPSIALSSCSRSPTPVHSHSLANCSFFVEIDIRVWFSSSQPHFCRRQSSCPSPDRHCPSHSTDLPHTLPKLLTPPRRAPPPRHRSPWS
nr:receptor-like protein 34 [Arachis hypogaea]